ncbi:hypothetical protein [Noviherbaspirillum saxi]|uniref:hypothetical protein n=1 Tax=Noviherbaspirillum saxi TaxID=2320863 RepID=UPI000E6D0779|nr:hypothetical protein [Noviherbaspirillum saxi]
MMLWFTVELSDEAIQCNEHVRLQENFERAWGLSGAPEEAAMYSGLGDGNTNKLYFSPGTESFFRHVLDACGAKPCDPPTVDEAGLLVGHDSARFALATSTANS